jgi:hypothetical protein
VGPDHEAGGAVNNQALIMEGMRRRVVRGLQIYVRGEWAICDSFRRHGAVTDDAKARAILNTFLLEKIGRICEAIGDDFRAN